MAGLYVVPRGMEEIIDYLKERYPNKPIFVLENGELIFYVKSYIFHNAHLHKFKFG